MSTFTVVSTVTHRSLMNKSKDDLARWILHLLDCRDDNERLRVQRVGSLLEADNRYQKVLVEVSGPKGSGKSAIISEIAQTLSRRGLNVRFADEAGYGATVDPAAAINLLHIYRPTVLLIERTADPDKAIERDRSGDHG